MTVGAVDTLGYITAWQAACWVAFRHFDDAPNQEGISYDPQEAEKMAREIRRYGDFCDSIPKAQTQLLEAIRHEKLPAYGANAGELTQIPVLYLNTEGVKLLSASNAIQSTHAKADADNKPKAWMDVKFYKADIVRLWPPSTQIIPIKRGRPKGSGEIEDSESLEKIHDVMIAYKNKHGKYMGIKTACESVVQDMGFPNDAGRKAAVERLRKKFRKSLGNK